MVAFAFVLVADRRHPAAVAAWAFVPGVAYLADTVLLGAHNPQVGDHSPRAASLHHHRRRRHSCSLRGEVDAGTVVAEDQASAGSALGAAVPFRAELPLRYRQVGLTAQLGRLDSAPQPRLTLPFRPP